MIDRHHPINTRAHWTSSKDAEALREKYLYPLDRKVHEELHRECAPVPLLGFHAVRHVLGSVYPRGNPQRDLDQLCRAIERAGQHPRSHPLEAKLGSLAIEAIQAQIPYLIGNKTTIIDLAEGA